MSNQPNCIVDNIFTEKKEFILERIVLKPFTVNDFDLFHALYSNEQTTKYLRIDSKQSTEQFKILFDKMLSWIEKEFHFTWTLSIRDMNQLIGTIGINTILRSHARADIGYMLSPDYWGNGFMSEAIEQILQYLFIDINFNKIGAFTANENIKSKKLLEKFKFRQEGLFKEHLYFSKYDSFVDEAYFSLFKKDYLIINSG